MGSVTQTIEYKNLALKIVNIKFENIYINK